MALKGSHWDHKARSQIMGRTKGASKPPKLRFRPGEFVREKKTGQLFCIIFAYRLVDEPSIWRFKLEEREDLGDPSTFLSLYCAEMAGEIPMNERIKWQPVYLGDVMQIDPRDYCHGDRETATTKRLLNDFEVVSSGEVL